MTANIQVPTLNSDWRGTNHFELTTPDSDDGYWWLDLGNPGLTEDQEQGQRIGYCLDAAAMRSRMTPERINEWCASRLPNGFIDPPNIILAFVRDIEMESCGLLEVQA